jgi:hypothetical protein
MDTDTAVSPDDDVELCRVQITNHSSAAKDLDFTSYREIVLAPSAKDSAHPAFAKLFVETEIVRERQAILCRRRPQTRYESTPWMFHMLVCHEPHHGAMSFETDRMHFIGRGRTSADPQAFDGNAALSDGEGAVLDAVAAVRRDVTINPGCTAIVDLISGVGTTRDACLALVQKYQLRRNVDSILPAASSRALALCAGGSAKPYRSLCSPYIKIEIAKPGRNGLGVDLLRVKGGPKRSSLCAVTHIAGSSLQSQISLRALHIARILQITYKPVQGLLTMSIIRSALIPAHRIKIRVRRLHTAAVGTTGSATTASGIGVCEDGFAHVFTRR